MAASWRVFLVLIAGSLFVSTLATKCYVCYSHEDSTCNDPYDKPSKHEIDCGGNVTRCSKSKALGKIVGLDFKSVNRTCGNEYPNIICDHTSGYKFDAPLVGLKDVTAWECSCDGDGCNSAVKTSNSIVAVALATIGCLFTQFI